MALRTVKKHMIKSVADGAFIFISFEYGCLFCNLVVLNRIIIRTLIY